MEITYHQDPQIIHIRNKKISYVIEIVDGK